MMYVYIRYDTVFAESRNKDDFDWCFRLYPGGKIWEWNMDAGEPHPRAKALQEWTEELLRLSGAPGGQPAVSGAQTL